MGFCIPKWVLQFEIGRCISKWIFAFRLTLQDHPGGSPPCAGCPVAFLN
jgi:hypothetical protein